MPTYKTPGVYIEEISKFPPSVAEVETAVPAFIGYTEKAEKRGQSLTEIPTKVMSLLEYEQLFGGEPPLTTADVTVDPDNHYAVDAITIDDRYYMYEALRMFFDNGGGKCYIVSVGNYETAIGSAGLTAGLHALAKFDEPTMILFPDAPVLPDAEFYTLQQLALAQCGRLQDRVALLDLKEIGQEWPEAVQEFRDGIGINNLKYGAAYTPWLRSSYPRDVPFSVFAATVTDLADAPIDLSTITTDPQKNTLVKTALAAQADLATVGTAIETLQGSAPTLKDRYRTLKDALSPTRTDAQNTAAFAAVLLLVRQAFQAVATWSTALQNPNIKNDLKAYAGNTLKEAVLAQVALEKNTDVLGPSDLATAAEVAVEYAPLDTFGGAAWLGMDGGAPPAALTAATIPASATDYTRPTVYETLAAILADLDETFQGEKSVYAFITQIQDAAIAHARITQNALYEGHAIVANIAEAIRKERAMVPPSGSVAGVYAYVDRTRGVWKAPANVSLTAVMEPVEQIDFFEQEDLNVDVNGGKSINAIRTFTGLGTLVWGARTLAGNDNEWRYVPVRRFFNMVEESVKKSTSWAVFEPNDANLWTKVKSMIDNYLFQKWRDGALAGSTPDKAFYVKVGLGETMTAQDILEGRLTVEIGMAVVRPAEFIVLKFSHKLQEV
jgi:hypothetical protein